MILLWIIGIYIAVGLAFYAYCVATSYVNLGFWDFNIGREHIGICLYPKWLLFWLYWIVRKVRG
jgi:hypothetical protein